MRRALLALILSALAIPAQAQTIDGPEEYRICLVLAKDKPEQGWEEALTWQSLGGGEAARHCGAVALIGLGKHAEAATRLETLANESVRDDSVRAQMLAQAAQAWMLAGKLNRADAALRGALILAPGDPEILLDHAVLLAQVHHYGEAVDILTGLLRRQPHRVEALVLRASAFRYQDNLPGARDDVEQALKLDPDFPDALLERGILRRLAGDEAGAREDWRRAIEVAPHTEAAETARLNIQKMEMKAK